MSKRVDLTKNLTEEHSQDESAFNQNNEREIIGIKKGKRAGLNPKSSGGHYRIVQSSQITGAVWRIAWCPTRRAWT